MRIGVATLGIAWSTVAFLVVLGATIAPPSGPTVGPRAAITAAERFSTPSLSLEVSPLLGNAPLQVNVTPVITGGVSPYNVSVCFAAAAHTSPPPTCATYAAGVSGPIGVPFGHTYFDPGEYSILGVVTDSAGARVGSTAVVTVTNASVLVATGTESTTTGSAPVTVTFNETVSGGTPPITIQWQFGDGTSGSEISGVPITHNYDRPGDFVPEVVVTDSAGHSTPHTFSPIQVTGGGSTTPSVGGIPLETLGSAFAVFLVPAVLAATGAWYLVRRRWRREGDELIEWLESENGTTGPPPPL